MLAVSEVVAKIRYKFFLLLLVVIPEKAIWRQTRMLSVNAVHFPSSGVELVVLSVLTSAGVLNNNMASCPSNVTGSCIALQGDVEEMFSHSSRFHLPEARRHPSFAEYIDTFDHAAHQMMMNAEPLPNGQLIHKGFTGKHRIC